jgi:putative FmdB family regulatory protein
MPLYEYQCESCSERLEAIQKFSDPLYTHCPKCGGNLKKLISSPAIQFKGSGFYITDYAKSSGKSETSSDGGGDSKSSSKSEAKESSGSAPAKSEGSSGSKSE